MSTEPTAPVLDPEDVPEELRERPTWVCWKEVGRNGKREYDQMTRSRTRRHERPTRDERSGVQTARHRSREPRQWARDEGHDRSTRHPLVRYQQTHGNQTVQRLVNERLQPSLQRTLSAGRADDRYEREADRVAERVMRTPGPAGERNEEIGPRAEPADPWSENTTPQPGVPATVHDTLRSPGRPLGSATRAFMEPRFGWDFGDVRVHTGSLAARSAADVGAHAYTVGRDVVFGAGQYAPGTRAGDSLLAHELVHTVQQGHTRSPSVVQREPDAEAEAERTPASRVVVVGSPSPGELAANHPLQFVNAARSFGTDENTLWLVERTGYELAGIDVGRIEQLAAPARVEWITPENDLVTHLNRLPMGSIREFRVYSHGVPASVTLRYNWPGESNYGLSIPNVRSMRTDLFASDAQVRFDSCNTGTSDWSQSGGNLAQSFAEQSGRPVEAWTGRTSYTETNQAAGEHPADVVASEKLGRHGGLLRRIWHTDWVEVLSQWGQGRTPVLRRFEPVSGTRVGGFTSTFKINIRLPKSRTFEVPEGGSVAITCSNVHVVGGADMSRPGIPQDVQITINRERFLFDADYDVRTFPVAEGPHREVWSNLDAGTYHVELWRLANTNVAVAGDIVVDVYDD
jgi:hypothetical protein